MAHGTFLSRAGIRDPGMTSRRLTLRYALVLALPVFIAASGAVRAQSPWPSSDPPPATGNASGPSPFDRPPAGSAPPASPFDRPPANNAPGPSPFDQLPAGVNAGLGQPPGEMPPCIKKFLPLRDDVSKKVEAINAAAKRKVAPKEACALFNVFVAAETKMLKYAEANSAACGIPPKEIDVMKAGHVRAEQIRAKVCQTAQTQQQQGPGGPSLGDALGASRVPDASNVKPGRGTFDTLTGTPLGKQ
jgi:hypothetical protein